MTDTTDADRSTNVYKNAFQKYMLQIDEALGLYPVTMSQLLYSFGCISDKTLNEIEGSGKSTEGRKTVLMKALTYAIKIKGEKLNLLADAFLQFEETSPLANQLRVTDSAEIEEVENPSPDWSTKVCPKEKASCILRYHYAKLAVLLDDTKVIANILCGGRVISQNDSTDIKHQSLVEDSRGILLKAVRKAVSSNHLHLKTFIDALKTAEYDAISKDLLKDYQEHIEQDSFARSRRESNRTVSKEIIAANENFAGIRAIFEKDFDLICKIIKKHRFTLEDLKKFVKAYSDGYIPDISKQDTKGVLEFVCDKCTLIDINYLEAVVQEFDVASAIIHIQSFTTNIKELCRYVTVRNVLDEKFFLSRSTQLLKNDLAIEMIIDQNPDHITLQFIKDAISTSFGSLAKSVQLVNIKEIDDMLLVTCLFPKYLSASVLVPESAMELMQRRGLVELTIDGSIYWKKEKDHIITKRTIPNDQHQLEEVVKELEESQKESRRLSMEVKILREGLMHDSNNGIEMQETVIGNDDETVEMKDAATQANILEINRKKIIVELLKESLDQTLGFNIEEGQGAMYDDKEQSVFITKITPGGLAEKDGRLKAGDCIVSVNGVYINTKAKALDSLTATTNLYAIIAIRESISENTNTQYSQYSPSVNKKVKRRSMIYRPSVPGCVVNFEKCASLPVAITNAQAVLYRNKVMVGGQDVPTGADYILEYDIRADNWQVFIKSPVHLFALTVFQNQLLVVGGFDFNQQKYSARVYSLYIDERNHFLRDDIIPPMLTARAQASVASQDQNIAVAGGRDAKSNLRSIEVFHAPTAQWHTAHSLLSERSSVRSILHKGSWYLLGGDMDPSVRSKNVRLKFKMLASSAVQKYGSISYMKTIQKPGNGEGAHSAVVTINDMIVVIGAGGTRKIYSLCREEGPISWIELGELPIVLTDSCAVTLEDQVLLIGGKDENGKITDSVYFMNLY
ncbi:PREDICTED: uncharacterized protein LOC109581195 isoform X2 [Amphimedon queenslandica]|uniref:PDZ domain-containing protein n=1 Tax=Amphimedon queenslandica TaxID=400682 RepID=A0A1X7V4V9_AMPQE|nr:PREDICTED: uncharacterized protein LOC109581195 isoform X2 [Amphimedon queenslandica]|eukprot:XP_019850627.1 PREDICTED: uncharacterized protein LOC109581195 isoform X2 [Amphimedon queenslandica]